MTASRSIALTVPSPHDLRDQLTDLVINDLLGQPVARTKNSTKRNESANAIWSGCWPRKMSRSKPPPKINWPRPNPTMLKSAPPTLTPRPTTPCFLRRWV